MDDARRRLDRAMNDRRIELRLRWVEIARRAAMSVTNLNLIRKGKIATITDLAAANLEGAFEWPRGHIATLLADGYSSAGYVAVLLDELVEKYGEEVLQEAIRLREAKKDLTEQQ